MPDKILIVHDAPAFVTRALANTREALTQCGLNPAVAPRPQVPLELVAEELSVYYGRPLRARIYPSPLALLEAQADPDQILIGLQKWPDLPIAPRLSWQKIVPWASPGLAFPPTVVQILLGALLSRTVPPSSGSQGIQWWGRLIQALSQEPEDYVPLAQGVPPEVVEGIHAAYRKEGGQDRLSWDLLHQADPRQAGSLLVDFVSALEDRLVRACGTKADVRRVRRAVTRLRKETSSEWGLSLPQSDGVHIGISEIQHLSCVLLALSAELGEEDDHHPYSIPSLARLLSYLVDYPGLFVREDAVWASQAPISITWVPQKGLHDESGPALRWRDGYEQYWLFNHPIPRAVYDVRGALIRDATAISRIPDPGVRDACVQLYGYESFVRATAAPSTSWVDPKTEYRWTLTRSRHRNLGLNAFLDGEAPPVVGPNPSGEESTKITIQVPPWYTSARQAWKYVQEKKRLGKNQDRAEPEDGAV